MLVPILITCPHPASVKKSNVMLDERREYCTPTRFKCIPGLQVRIKAPLGKRGRDAGWNDCAVLRVRSTTIDVGSNRDPSDGTRKRDCAAGEDREKWRALPAPVTQLLHAAKTHAGVISITGRRQVAKAYQQRKLRSPRAGWASADARRAHRMYSFFSPLLRAIRVNERLRFAQGA